MERTMIPTEEELLAELVDFLTPPVIEPGWYPTRQIAAEMMAHNPQLTRAQAYGIIRRKKDNGLLDYMLVGNIGYYRIKK